MADSISKPSRWDTFNGFIPDGEVKDLIIHTLIMNTVDTLLSSSFKFKLEVGEPFDVDLPVVSIEHDFASAGYIARMSTVFRFHNESVCIEASANTV